MKRKKQASPFREQLKAVSNISAFCARHKLPLRTVMRIKAGGVPSAMTSYALRHALESEQ